MKNLIINGKIFTMAGAVIENGYISFENGIITAVGDMKDRPSANDYQLYDVQGDNVCPGLIDCHCHIGVYEDALGFEGEDGNEETDPITPTLQGLDAVNHKDRCFEEALCAGITTVVTGPGSANPIAGTMVALKTIGNSADEMVLKQPLAMKMALGENPKKTYSAAKQSPMTRMATAALIREALQKAIDYKNKKSKDKDYKSAALLPVIEKKIPAHFHAHRQDDIFTAIRLAKEFSLKFVLVHCTEGKDIAKKLAEIGANVIIGPIICERSKPELKELDVKSASILYNAGVNFAICTDHPVTPIQYLPITAGLAVRAGLPYLEGLKAITINAAKIIGLEDRIGSIEVGKDADFAIFNGDILSNFGLCKAVYVKGKKVH